jgi:glycosyltransferase involved in cell wall biosynthesis
MAIVDGANPVRILFTTNIDLPEVACDLGLKPTSFGGWLSTTIKGLSELRGFKIGVAMRSNSPVFKCVDKGGVVYFALPQKPGSFDVSQADVERVINDFVPDLLHVEGAELPHSLRFLKTWNGPRVLSMQGVLNGIKRYQLGGLPISRMLIPSSPRLTLVAIALLANYWKRFLPRLAIERESMRQTRHILGRTLWDQAQAAQLAPDAHYYKCSRTLRSPFYDKRWNAANKEEYSIFLGNSAVPLKGVHVVIEALSILARRYPNCKLYIAGQNPGQLGKFSLSRYFGYSVYLNHLIKKLGLDSMVFYTGSLSASQMADKMASSHVCLVSSIIENSPNTLGEAMMVGAPVVSAYAGGAPSMAADEKEALFYRPEDPVMLAFQVRRIFDDPELAEVLSQNGRARASVNHDAIKNLNDLLSVYNDILSGE